jgi:beta-lysine 5,6-aminomutase alpha subunit
LLKDIKQEGLFKALEKGRFAEISRHEDGGKGLQGVFVKHPDYQNPVLSLLQSRLKEEQHVS